jgi:hypothetical protein
MLEKELSKHQVRSNVIVVILIQAICNDSKKLGKTVFLRPSEMDIAHAYELKWSILLWFGKDLLQELTFRNEEISFLGK